jgi:hypothetical protein
LVCEIERLPQIATNRTKIVLRSWFRPKMLRATAQGIVITVGS